MRVSQSLLDRAHREIPWTHLYHRPRRSHDRWLEVPRSWPRAGRARARAAPYALQPSAAATLAEMPRNNVRDGARATIIVRNPAVHDARVLRAADTLLGLGFQVEILGIQSRFDADPPAAHGPAPIRRLGSSRSLGPALQGAVETL